jgi:hypothetical protein
MKIYDIIAESQQLNENVLIMTGFRQLLKYVSSRNGQGLEHAMEWIAKRLAGKAGAAEQLAEAWILAAEKVGISEAEAVALGAEKAAKAGIADDVIAAAKRAADKLIEKRANSVWGQLKTPDSKTNFWWGASWKTINAGLTFWGIVEPILECKENIMKLYEMRERGEPELQDLNKLNWAVQWYIDKCVQQVVSIWAGNKIVGKVVGSWVPGVVYNIPIAGKLFGKLDPLYSKLTPVAQAGFKTWMMTSDGQEALAKWIVGEAMLPGTEWKIPGGEWYKKAILNPLSGLALTGYNKISRYLNPNNPNIPPDPNANKKDKKDDEYKPNTTFGSGLTIK